ncbi:efflux RND transporter periplasmic adaptor subunit [Aquaspirillum sp. LM1]|uniref:efflux RND transporter periplasmic adaptor subunit n=1 Tax=Aquaspirillum sp. LM1 TaxID=1938604 RepID=UPI0015C571AE|nr:efflux RND transporter periplasmic adaptor subunit [Aquaspirillum sp. LM1]
MTALIAVATFWMIRDASSAASPTHTKPVLSVTVVRPQRQHWPVELAANGNIVPWHEAIISSDVAQLRLTQVLVDVGDRVKAGQVLATWDDIPVRHELAQAVAMQEQAQAVWAETAEQTRRAQAMRGSGAISEQHIAVLEYQLQAAKARVAAASSQVDSLRLRLYRTQVRAPDDGVISARSASMGVVATVGGELFRLLRQQRLQWRAELGASDLARLPFAAPVQVQLGDGVTLNGIISRLAPSIDPRTRQGWVYVDIPTHPAARAGMFAQGRFVLAQQPALTLPHQAVVMREAFSYVFELEALQRVILRKVQIGRRQSDRVEVLSGLSADAQVVASGAGFLNDGDTVRVLPSALPGQAREAS